VVDDRIESRVSEGGNPGNRLRAFLRLSRLWVDKYPSVRWIYRLAVALLGTVIIVIGAALIPLPGPGWLVVFLGVACLGTEFPAAHRLAAFMKRVVARGVGWWSSRRAATARRSAATE